MTNATITKFGHPASLVRDYEHWVVLLRPAQVTAGSLVLAAKGDATAYGALPQQAFIEHGGAQCGICTPGMVLAAAALLEQNPNPTLADMRHGLAGNLCRCTGYMRIFESVVAAMRSSPS